MLSQVIVDERLAGARLMPFKFLGWGGEQFRTNLLEASARASSSAGLRMHGP